MDLTIIADLINSIHPVILGGVAAGTLVLGGSALYIKHTKKTLHDHPDNTQYIDNHTNNQFDTLKTEDIEQQFGSLTIKSKTLDEDESLFFDKKKADIAINNTHNNAYLQDDLYPNEPSTKLVNEASVFDCFSKYEQAIECIQKAIQIEQHSKEKIRLKILLTQYNKQKGTITLENLISQYPSFHTMLPLDIAKNNPTSASQPDLNKNVHTQLDTGIDIFSDLPVLIPNDKHNVPNNLLDQHLLSHDISSPLLDGLEKKEKQIDSSASSSHQLNNDNVIVTPVNIHLDALDQFKPDTDLKASDNHTIEQFSWSTKKNNTNDQEDTELMLKQLQTDADAIDKLNQNEAIDDMQKFWKEFGNIIPQEEHLESIDNIAKDNTSLVKENNIASSHNEQPIVHNTTTIIQENKIALKEEVKLSKPYKVWANWIVNQSDTQIFRNHFINLKNPWGSSLAAEELYTGINKLSGKNIDGKAYSWVLVSVFPLAIEHN